MRGRRDRDTERKEGSERLSDDRGREIDTEGLTDRQTDEEKGKREKRGREGEERERD